MPNAQNAQLVKKILCDLIRIDTTNPGKSERPACDYLADLFRAEGLEPQILESAPGRANLIVRIKGSGAKEPLLLASHLDVVPAEAEFWDVDPFSGIEKDGFIWGRGAIDMKNKTALDAVVMILIKRSGIRLSRDVIFVAVADEESGCQFGSEWLVKNHPELVQAEYALGEVGGFSLQIDDKRFYPIGVAEKGLCWLNVTVSGSAGHGSMPHNHQALGTTGGILCRLTHQSLPYKNSKPAFDFIDSIAKNLNFFKSLFLRFQKNSLSQKLISKLIKDKNLVKRFLNLTHNTATPTIIKSGFKENVIPSKVSMTVDGRILPGSTVDEFLTEFKKVLGVECQIDVTQCFEPNQSEWRDDKVFNFLCKSLKKHDPEAIAVPFLVPGFTDAKSFRKLGTKFFGFVPLQLPADIDFASLYHGHNERIPADSFLFSLNVLWDGVMAICDGDVFL